MTVPVLSRNGFITAELDEIANIVRVWDVRTGKDIRRISVKELDGNPRHGRWLEWFNLSPDGQWLALHLHRFVKNPLNPLDDKLVLDYKLVHIRTGKKSSLSFMDEELGPVDYVTLRADGSKPLTSLFSPDSQVLALPVLVGNKICLRLWDLISGNVRSQIQVLDPKGWIQALAFSPDGRSLAADLGGDELTVWEVATGKERCRWKKKPLQTQFIARIRDLLSWGTHSPRPTGSKLTFSPDGKILIEGRADRTVGVWDVVAGKELGVLHGHHGAVQTVAFAADGKTMASGSADTTVLLWDMTRWTQSKKVSARGLSDRELEIYWVDLVGLNAAKGFQTMVALADSPKQAIPFLRKHLQPIPAVDPQRIQRLIGDLNSDTYATRKKASIVLQQEGELALPLLCRALKDQKLSLEAKKRLQELITKLSGQAISGERLRQLRAVEALERMNTPEAKQLLQTLAQGAPEGTLTREAQAALNRTDQ